MAFQNIDIGASANDGTGDPLRTAFDKVNDNIAETLNKTGDTMTGGLAFSGTNHAGVKHISLTTAQITALTPAPGMVVYDSTVGKYKAYGTLGWFEIDGGVFNVKSFGAVGDGVADDRNAFQSAFNAANTAGGGVVFMPSGTYRMTKPSGTLTMYSNTTLQGAGDTSIIFHDDKDSEGRVDLLDVDDDSENIAFMNFKIKGVADLYPNQTNISQCLTGDHITNLTIFKVTFEDLRFMATAFSYVNGGKLTHNTLRRVMRDGLRCVNSENIIVVLNNFYNVSDDAVALHSLDSATWPGSGNIVSLNTFEACQGVKVLGAKATSVSRNVFKRMIRTPIDIRLVHSGTEGNTALIDIDVSDNIIQDTYGVYGSNNVMSIRPYAFEDDGLTPVQPGVNATPYDYNWTNNLDASGVIVGGFRISANNNKISRTLPNVTNYSDYGYGDLYDYVTGWPHDPAVTDADYACHGMQLYGAVNSLSANDNQISGLGVGFTAITLTADAASPYPDFNNAKLERNIIQDCPGVGIDLISGDASAMRNVTLRGNEIDLDPYMRHTDHNTDNTWDTAANCIGIKTNGNIKGWICEQNKFSHCATPIGPSISGLGFMGRNFVVAEPASYADNASNLGVRALSPRFGYVQIAYDGDPTSAAFGEVTTMPLRGPAGIHPGLGFTAKTISTTRFKCVSGTIAAADVLYLYPFFIPEPFIFSGGRARVITGGAGSSIKVGIWATDTSLGANGNKPSGACLVADNTGVATATSATTVIPAFGGTLMPGFYWMGVKTTGTPPTVYCVNESEFGWLMGGDSGLASLINIGYSIADTYSNNMPTLAAGAAFTDVTTAILPAVSLTGV